MDGIPCPNCGAPVQFRSAGLPVRVCDYCRTMVMRTDAGVENVGTAAILPFDVSPLQIGASGTLDGAEFEIIGRVRWRWTDGAWNEWLMLFRDGSHGWLGEAMGELMALRETEIDDAALATFSRLLLADQVIVGQETKIRDTVLTVSDVRPATCVAAGGELPFTAPAGWTIRNVDFRGPDGSCASFQHDGSEASVYLGRYVTLAELRPRGLRAIEGWAMPTYG